MLLPLKPHQRLKVYKRALETYKRHAKEMEKSAKTSTYKKECDGMCSHINAAITYLRYEREHYRGTSSKAKYFPEYHTFKPNTPWKERPDFWWSRRSSTGIPRRIAVLTALAEGKVKK